MINKLTYKMRENMKEKILEYSHCFNQSREDNNLHELDLSLGSLELAVCHYDDFESFVQFRPDSHDDMSFPSLEQ